MPTFGSFLYMSKLMSVYVVVQVYLLVLKLTFNKLVKKLQRVIIKDMIPFMIPGRFLERCCFVLNNSSGMCFSMDAAI